jgi:serine phosphatase RsbU (regulator of sigma subunit)
LGLLESFLSSPPPSEQVASAVRDYVNWQAQERGGHFVPSGDDDVDIRTYLLHRRASGEDPTSLKDCVTALECFYSWAQAQGFTNENPFSEYDLGRGLPSLPTYGVGPEGHLTTAHDPLELDMGRLLALRQIAEALNSSVDIRTALDSTLSTLLGVMNLQTGWISISTDSFLRFLHKGASPVHGFALVAARGLPPALEHDDRLFLRQPSACHCQRLLMDGRLTRAVNIVECTRLRNATQAAGDTGDLVFHASVPLISQGKPLGVVNAAAREWESLLPADLDFLSAVGAQLVVALERAQFYELARARQGRLEHELRVAREVQESLMPRSMPEIPGFCLASTWRPARQISGDFFDIFPLNRGRWGIVIGDVADKGTPAALHMAMVHTLILSGARRHRSPAAVLREAHAAFRRHSSSITFVTVFLAVLDPKSGSLRYTNAGHDPPIVRRADGSLETLVGNGIALGLFDELQLRDETVRLGTGDGLVLFTDGVTEARNQQGLEQYGLDRLSAAITAAPRKGDALLAHVEADVNAFAAGAAQRDDITLLVLARD